MSQAKSGDTVQVHYTGKLQDGTVFDTSQDREPLEFTLGEGRLIPGFEDAVVGMQLNESKEIKIEAEDAYGPHREDLVMSVDREQFPDNIEPKTGQQLEIRLQNGQTKGAVITEVSPTNITLDTNHPLAGQNLKFDILLVKIA